MKIALLLAACFFSSWIQAQVATATRPNAATVELPSGPLLRSAPELSQWEITFTYPDNDHKKSKSSHKQNATPAELNARPKKIVTTKTGRIIHEVQTDILNRISDTWYDGGNQYSKSPQDSVWYQPEKMATGADANVAYHPLPANGFRNMALVNKENYAGMTSYDNRQCLVFTPGGSQTLNLNNADEAKRKLKLIDEIAYVDAETRLPVAVRTLDDLRSFQYDPPPLQAQQLPADLLEQIKNGEDAHSRLNQPASRPY